MEVIAHQLNQKMASLSNELEEIPNDFDLCTQEELARAHEIKMELSTLDREFKYYAYGIACREDIELRNRLNITLARMLKQPRNMIRSLELSIPELQRRIDRLGKQQNRNECSDQLVLI